MGKERMTMKLNNFPFFHHFNIPISVPLRPLRLGGEPAAETVQFVLFCMFCLTRPPQSLPPSIVFLSQKNTASSAA